MGGVVGVMMENTARQEVCVNLKMSVTVFLSMVIYIRNDNMRKKNGGDAKRKEAVHWRRGEVREGGGKSNDSEWGALRCGERIIQNPEYE